MKTFEIVYLNWHEEISFCTVTAGNIYDAEAKFYGIYDDARIVDAYQI